MIIYVSLLVALVSANPKLVEIGRIMFAFGLFTFLLRAADSLLPVIR